MVVAVVGVAVDVNYVTRSSRPVGVTLAYSRTCVTDSVSRTIFGAQLKRFRAVGSDPSRRTEASCNWSGGGVDKAVITGSVPGTIERAVAMRAIDVREALVAGTLGRPDTISSPRIRAVVVADGSLADHTRPPLLATAD